ncbi:hypothetical protein V499_03379 [Pseudogymnoascus sp. VKM F-103]|nr:hypothetical protein V499_03379 [Pseudogymnoascus sp. VKM F-103]
MQRRLPFDDVAWEQSDNVYFEWRTKLLKPETLTEIALFVAKYHLGTPVEVRAPLTGAYNVAVVIDFSDGGSTLIRFPKPGKVMFPEEKVRNEVAVMRDALNTPGIPYEERPILDPSIDGEKPRGLYGQVADVLLQLSMLSFLKIGSLAQVDDGDTWSVTERPLSSNMNEIVQLGTLPRSKLPDKSATFETSSSYLTTLANLHLRHLTHQRNDAIDSAKRLSPQIYCKIPFPEALSREQTIAPRSQFRAFQTLSPSYSAPVEFSHAPPWWLLIEQPEYWPRGIDKWITAYEPRLQTILAVLREREDALIQEDRLGEQQRLSLPMRESWDCGDFWLVYAARKGFTFNAAFWKYLDARFFGPVAGLDGDEWERRAGLLDEEEIMEIDSFVEQKVEELKTRVLAWKPEEQLG